MKEKTVKATWRNIPVNIFRIFSLLYLIALITFSVEGHFFDFNTMVSLSIIMLVLIFVRKFEISVQSDRLRILRKSLLPIFNKKYDFEFIDYKRFELIKGEELPAYFWNPWNNRKPDQLKSIGRKGNYQKIDLKGDYNELQKLIEFANNKLKTSHDKIYST